MRWHHSRQKKTDPPIGTSELRRLAAEGQIGPTDLVRPSGSRRWITADKVEGLFNPGHQEWYYLHDQRQRGPFTLGDLWNEAEAGSLGPNDLVWKPGMLKWKRAVKLVGLFRVPESPAARRSRRSSSRRLRPAERKEPWWTTVKVRLRDCGSGRLIPLLAGFCLLSLVVLVAGFCFRAVPNRSVAPGPGSASTAETKPNGDTADRAAPAAVPPRVGPGTHNQDLRTSEFGSARSTTRKPEAGPLHDPGPSPEPQPADRPLDLEEEVRVGRAVRERILGRHKVLADESIQQRLRSAAAPLLEHRRRRDLDPSFTILDSEKAFAFSHPGEYLYVSRGLFNLIKSEVELQFILGQEFAHLSLRHLEQAAGVRTRGGDGPSGLVRRIYRQIALGYAEEQVFEADAWSFRTLRQLGHPTYRVLSLLSPRYDFNGAPDPRGTRRKPETDPAADRQDIENHWQSNPPAAERFERLQALDTRGRSTSVTTAGASKSRH
jgi:hypothetical protein